jgi:hypothetical protein
MKPADLRVTLRGALPLMIWFAPRAGSGPTGSAGVTRDPLHEK